MAIRAVVFDVGGTLVDETRMFSDWADWLEVPRLDFFAAVGATVALGEPHRRVFEMVAPGVDLRAARRAREAAGRRFRIEERDLYPDAAGCLAACRAAGLIVGIAGNQPLEAKAALDACGLAADFTATSAAWGVEKPDPAFFERVITACGVGAGEIAYVGDRVDNDVVPARAAGLQPVLVVRGPWGVVQAGWPEASAAARVVRRLDGLAQLLGG